MVTKVYREVATHFASRHVYGFTATDRRTDGQGPALEFYFGPKLVDRKVERATPDVRFLTYTGSIPMGEYAEIIARQSNDPERNQLVADACLWLVGSGRKVLVLTKRVAHHRAVAQMLAGGGRRVYSLGSGGGKKEFKELLASFRRSGEFDCLLGTFSLLSTGVDLPSLDTLVIAGDLKSDVLHEQSAGRILRLFEGKKDPLIMDVEDVGNPILRNQARLRRKFYEAQGWRILEG